jgi:hypothetical protein
MTYYVSKVLEDLESAKMGNGNPAFIKSTSNNKIRQRLTREKHDTRGNNFIGLSILRACGSITRKLTLSFCVVFDINWFGDASIGAFASVKSYPLL